MDDSKFNVGDLVQIIGTDEIGTVNKVRLRGNGYSYSIFKNGKNFIYSEDKLEPYVDLEEQIYEVIESNIFSNADDLRRYYYNIKYSSNQNGNLYSYKDNKITFNPFQYKPLFKFLNLNSDERLLIGDEVGVGKTIETGIIIDELLSRQEIGPKDVIMIVCPHVLCKKWQKELAYKFSMRDFIIHNSSTLEHQLNEYLQNSNLLFEHSIVSEQLIRSDKFIHMLSNILEQRDQQFISLLVVDECHHFRNKGTKTNQIGSLLSQCSERVIMLSATPFNLQSSDLFNQLSILNPAEFDDEDIFNQMSKQIRLVNEVIRLIKNEYNVDLLINKVSELYKYINEDEYLNTELDGLIKHIKDSSLDTNLVIHYENVLNMLNPLATSFTRTLKKEAYEKRITRENYTIKVKFSPKEQEIYDEFLELGENYYLLKGVNPRAMGLILNGLERIAASSIIALDRNIQNFINNDFIEDNEAFMLDFEIENENYFADSKEELNNLLSNLANKIKSLNGYDTKYLDLKRLISDIQYANTNNPRIIVFSYYVATLKYLLEKLTKDGYRVNLMYGATPENTTKDAEGNTVLSREDIIESFKQGDFDILLVSEVGGEGLDYQFCSALINYDLPYNPMRIEQRIGRIDRMGQESQKIFVGNLCIDNTIDMTINRVLLSRINQAEDFVGELEPIIATQMKEINQMIISKNFTLEQIKQRENEMELQFAKAVAVREEFDEQRMELINDTSFREEFEKEVKKNRIDPYEIMLFTSSFIKSIPGCSSKQVNDRILEVRFSKKFIEEIEQYHRKGINDDYGNEINYILNHDDLEFVFDIKEERYNRLFIKNNGSWVKFMIYYLNQQKDFKDASKVYSIKSKEKVDQLKKGQYYCFSYILDVDGFSKTSSIHHIVLDENNKLIDISSETVERIIANATNSKKEIKSFVEKYDEMRFIADDEMELIKEEYTSQYIIPNKIKIENKIKSIKNLTEKSVADYKQRAINEGKSAKVIESVIKRKETLAYNKIQLLQKKQTIVTSITLIGIIQIEVV